MSEDIYLAELQRVVEQMNAIQESHDSMQREFLQERASLLNEMERLRTSQRHTPQEPTPEPATPVVRTIRPRAIFPDVEPFTGDDLTLYPAFRVNLNTKFTIDASVYATEEERVLYAFSRLRTKATKRILPWISAQQASANPLRTADFYEVLDRAFKDPDVQKKALVRLNHMKLGNKDLREFMADFDQTLVEAGGIAYPDEVKKGYLEAALNKEILTGMVGAPIEESYDDYRHQVQKVHEQQQRLARIKNYPRTTYLQPNRPARPARTNPDVMDWEATTKQMAALQAQVAALRTGQANEARTPAKWATQEVRDRRRKEGKCLRCGRDNHMIRDCSYGPPVRPSQVAVVKKVESDDEDDFFDLEEKDQDFQ